jgi:hypothetical protein
VDVDLEALAELGRQVGSGRELPGRRVCGGSRNEQHRRKRREQRPKHHAVDHASILS